MKNNDFIKPGKVLSKITVFFAATIVASALLSFTVNNITGEFFKELGMTKSAADTKISSSILGGYLNAYGTKNITNIVMAKRAALVKDLLVYTKEYVNTAAFKKEYNALKEQYKPAENKIETPQQMRTAQVEVYKKSITEMEANLKTADATLKPMIENMLVDVRKQLKEVENPNNKIFLNYSKNYEQLVKTNQQSYNRSLQEWEAKYPANQLLFVKQRLVQFLTETKDIDFGAELTQKNNKLVFVNPVYEKQKGYYWKMAFRAGKEVVEPARAFVQQWIEEIK